VKTTDLNLYLSKPVDLLKIDVEGAEYDLLLHIRKSLAKVRNISLECHVAQHNIKPLAKVLDCLVDEGFTIGVNSFGPWRDLIRRPQIPPDHWEQYLVIAASRNPMQQEGPTDGVIPYVGAAWLDLESRLESALKLAQENASQSARVQEELAEFSNSRLCRMARKLSRWVH